LLIEDCSANFAEVSVYECVKCSADKGAGHGGVLRQSSAISS
jgi:hypothetical protein